MRHYTFKVTLQGDGQTPEDAWDDALATLFNNPGSPPPAHMVKEAHPYTDFADALENWRMNGGALEYTHPTVDCPGTWYVWDYDDLDAHIAKTGPKLSLRECTENALAMGGMTTEQIANEMRDWQD